MASDGRAKHAPLSGDDVMLLNRGVEHDRLVWLPDSSRVIFRSVASGSSEFWSIAPTGGPAKQLTVMSRGSKPRVSPDGRWLAYLSAKSGASEIWLSPLAEELGAEDRQLTRLHGTVATFNWHPRGDAIVLGCAQTGYSNVFEVDISSGDARRLTSDQRRHEHYPVYSPDGARIFFIRMSESWGEHDVVSIARDGGDEQLIVRETDFFDYRGGRQIGHPVISPDGGRLLFRSRRSGYINYWYVDLGASRGPNGAEPRPLVSEPWPHSAESGSMIAGEAVWSPDSQHVCFFSNHDGNMRLCVVGRDGGAPTVLAAPETGCAHNPAWSPDGRSIAFLHESFLQPADVWVLDVKEKGAALRGTEPRQLTDSMPATLGRKFTRPEKVRYRTFDGQLISAYLFRARGADARPGPAIIEVHGGPPDQFRDTMHVVVQYYAQRGYSVLMPNIRGSAGYGKKFERAISTGFGVDDLKDLIAGAEFLAREGIADPKRIAITGQSYGGFLSMAAAVFAPEAVFQCSIARTGYADWLYYYEHSDSETVRLMEWDLGLLEQNREKYERSSPIRSASRAQTPLFVVDQASDGTSYEIDRRLDLVRELKRFGKPARYKKYDDTGGTYARSESGAKQMLPDMMRYFAEHIGS